MQDLVLTVDKVSKSYGARRALDAVDLRVGRGEFVALLGPNGAGKTTLFQLLSGLFVVDDGRISVLGEDLAASPIKALAGIGIVFQQPTLDMDLPVRSNLQFHARLHGMSGASARARIDEELERLELADRAAESVRALSGGNRRKVELARSLLHDPAVLLMDEATVGLDPASRRQLLDYVLELCRQRGVGVLWATHLVEEAERADRVVVLHQGTIRFDGAAAGLIEQTGSGSLAEAFLTLTRAKPNPPQTDAGAVS